MDYYRANCSFGPKLNVYAIKWRFTVNNGPEIETKLFSKGNWRFGGYQNWSSLKDGLMDEILSTLLLITVSNRLTKGKGNLSEILMKFWLILVFFLQKSDEKVFFRLPHRILHTLIKLLLKKTLKRIALIFFNNF